MIITKDEKEKRESIVKHVNKSIFVEAGAGAGKTTLIVERVISQIRQGIRPEQLVVITFTNLAAGELYERIEHALIEGEKKDTYTPEERQNFTYAIEHMEQMTISTIHSFCLKLLQQKAFEAGIPLDSELLENDREIARKNAFFKKWLSDLSSDDIMQLEDAVQVKGITIPYHRYIEAAFLSVCEKPSDVKIICPNEQQLVKIKQDIEMAKKNCDILEAQMAAEVKKAQDELAKIVALVKGQPFTARDIRENAKVIKVDYRRLFQSVEEKDIKGVTKGKKLADLYSGETPDVCMKNSKALKEDASDIETAFLLWLEENIGAGADNTYKRWLKAADKTEEMKMYYACFVLLKYAMRARDAYRMTMDGRELSNDEILQRAKDLVCGSKEAREAFRRKYRCIYVDEFQDTDHIQAEMIWALASDEEGMLREGALFVVGDPKQAIYSFRGGEPTVYYEIKKRMQDMGQEAEVYELDDNYRSCEEIISWVNAQFQEAFKDGPITYRNMIYKEPEASEEPSAPANDILKGVYSLHTNSGGDEAAEAMELVKFIKQLVNGNYYVWDMKRQKNKTKTAYLRKIRYDDFLILCPYKKTMKPYLDEMAGADLPVNFAGELSLDGNFVLQSFVRLFNYLVSPGDPKRRQGAMHIVARGDTTQDTDIARERLKELRRNVKGMSHRAIAFYLSENPQYLLPWDVVLPKAHLRSVKAKLLQMTETVLAKSGNNPMQLSEMFTQYSQAEIEQELSPEENPDAVRFMNVHKAKGLEGTITILMDRQRMYGLGEPNSYMTPEKNAEGYYEYYGVIAPKKQKKEWKAPLRLLPYKQSPEMENIGQKSAAEGDQERIRLEYVTATRAKQVLIVCSPLAEEIPFFGRYEIPTENSLDHILAVANLETPVQTGVQAEPKIYQPPCDAQLTENMLSYSYISISPSMFEVAGEKEEEDGEEPKQKTRRPKGKAFGTTMHRSFELLVQRRDEKDVSADACICQAIAENYTELLFEGKEMYLTQEEEPECYPEAVRSFLGQALERFWASEEIQTLFAQAKEVYTELPFSYFTSKNAEPEFFKEMEPYLDAVITEDTPIWINGITDLVVQKEDGSVVILDYKSDIMRGSDLEQYEKVLSSRYEGQLSMYRHCMSKKFSVSPEKVSTKLYHLYK